MLRALLFVVFAACLAAPAGAEEFYAATEQRYFRNTDTDSMYYNLAGSRPRILFDDVTVPFTGTNSLFQVTKVTVKISREANAPALAIRPYYSQIVADSAVNGGSGDLPDFPDVQFAIPFSTPVVLAAKGNTSFDETLVTFGNGSTTLFVVPGSAATGVPEHHSFALGLDLSLAGDANSDNKVNVLDLVPLATNWLQNASPENGDFNFDGVVNAKDLGILAQNWQMGTGTQSDAYKRNGWTISYHGDNQDLLWDYGNPSDFAEFTYDHDFYGGLIIGTQYLRVEGQVIALPPPGAMGVPEPAMGGWVILILLATAVRSPRPYLTRACPADTFPPN